MRKSLLVKILIVMAVLLAGSLFGGCGKKGDPRCPKVDVPVAISDLSVKSYDGYLELSWKLPRNEKDIDRLKILRSELEISGDDCPGCPRTYANIVDIAYDDPRVIREEPGLVKYRDSAVSKGLLYSYKVVICDSAGIWSNESNIAELKYK